MKKAVVLIVEDEALIRMSAVQMVEDAGYTAIEACNADEAVQILESRSDVAAVFTDIRMPGSMDGLTLAHAIRARWTPIHLIVTSGTNGQGELPANGRLIHKPYSAHQVTTALSELFGSHHITRRLLKGGGGDCDRGVLEKKVWHSHGPVDSPKIFPGYDFRFASLRFPERGKPWLPRRSYIQM